MKKTLTILAVLALVGCGKEQAPAKPVAEQPAQPVRAEPQPVQPPAETPVILSKEQAKTEAQKLYKDIKSAQADGAKVMEFLNDYPEQGGEVRNVSVKFNTILDNKKLDAIRDDYFSCVSFATYARMAWQDTYGLRISKENNSVTMSKLDMIKQTKKELSQYEKDCKGELAQ